MEIAFRSDIGQRRTSNQDYTDAFTNRQNVTLALLADGMGGHQAGDLASRSTVADLGQLWQDSELTDPEKVSSWMVKHIQEENHVIYKKGQERPETTGMGTTVVAAALFADCYVIGHVGDSRAYLFRDGQLKQLTEDHSLVNELVRSGEITKEMAATHPRRNVLTRSVGMPGDVEVDVTEIAAVAGDILLLCSDGLTNMVSEADIQTVLHVDAPLAEKADTLIAAANEAGGVDNITVFLIAKGGSPS